MPDAHKINFLNDTRAIAGQLADAFNRARARGTEAAAVGYLDPTVAGHVTDDDCTAAGHADLDAEAVRNFYAAIAALGQYTEGGVNTVIYRVKNS